MSRLITLFALLIVSLALVEGLVYLYLYINAPTGNEEKALHYGFKGTIIGMNAGLFVTPIVFFILYGSFKSRKWFKKLQESILQSIIVLLILVIATIVPYLVSSALKEHQIDKELSSQLTEEDIQIKWFDHPANLSIPMKNVCVRMENKQVYVNMEYDEQAAKLRKIKDSRSEFQEDLLFLVNNLVDDMSPYKVFISLTLQVKYKNEMYNFNQIPLKNEENQPFTVDNKEIVTIIKSKMNITQIP